MGTANKVLRCSINRFFFSPQMHLNEIFYVCRHTTAVSGNEIDAAAMQFERRFHISVDASEDREQQVD